MLALVDCNNFFCSVERVFSPGLWNKPLCVAGGNDGIIVALTQEAKDLGLKRGDAVFKVRELIEKHNVKLFSTNMPLYASMSKRIVSILKKSFASVENYSIDESFCYLDGYESLVSLEKYMREIVQKIALYTDIPVSVGIAPTKTLAKVANKFAKKYKAYNSVCVIDTEEKRRKALSLFSLEDVWGVGKHSLKRLNDYGVFTTMSFADKTEAWVKNKFNLPIVNVWKELNGEPCIEISEHIYKQSICTSRTFGKMLHAYDDLKSAVVAFASSSARKLRQQNSVTKAITVFVSSNRFREDLPMYINSYTEYLACESADTLEIVNASISALERIYKEDIFYKKAGVILSDISKDNVMEYSLFDNVDKKQDRKILMDTIDYINKRYGTQKIHLGIEGGANQLWIPKSDNRSKNYLTDINDILTIKI